MSFRKNNYEIVVQWLKAAESRDVFVDECSRACCRSKSLKLHNTVTVQIVIFFIFYGSLFDWHLITNKQTKQRNFLRQAVFLSRKLVPLEFFCQTSCLFSKGTCFTWVFSPDILSAFQGNFFHSSCFLSQCVNIIVELVPPERFPERSCLIPLINFLIYSRLSRWKKWLTTLAVFLLITDLSFYACSFLQMKFPYLEKSIEKISLRFFLASISISFLQSSCCNLYIHFRLFC